MRVFQAAALCYSMLASFVLSSALRNQRERRPHGRPIMLLGMLTISASLTLGVLLLGWAGVRALSS